MKGLGRVVVGLTAVVVSGSPAAAQAPAAVRAGVVVEDYAIDPGLGFESIRQITVPVVAEWAWSGRARLTLASGWTEARLGIAGGEDRVVSGALDPEARLRVSLVRDRIDVVATGSLPSGTATVEEADAALLGPLGNDLFGFATPSLGAGGSVGLGLAGAGTAGAASVGWGIHGRLPLSYEPLVGSGDAVRAGAELRVRAGLEAPLGRRAQLRTAVVASFRRQDELNDQLVNGVGHRVAGYLSVDLPVGSTFASLWGSGLFRADPSLEPSAVGAAFVPRGHYWAAGARWTVGWGARTRIEPEFEYRSASSATDATGREVRSLGDLVRIGGRLRRGWARDAWLVLEGHTAFGSVRDEGAAVDVRGVRGALYVEWVR